MRRCTLVLGFSLLLSVSVCAGFPCNRAQKMHRARVALTKAPNLATPYRLTSTQGTCFSASPLHRVFPAACGLHHSALPSVRVPASERFRAVPRHRRFSMQEAGQDAGSLQRIQAHGMTQPDVDRFCSSLTAANGQRIIVEDAVGLRTKMEADPRAFNLNLFFSQLHSQKLGKIVLYNSTLPSTQTLLFKELSLETDGVVCVADTQQSGKGRGDNVWVSPEGCLVFSFTANVNQPALIPFFQYIVSMAIYRAVSQLVGGDAKDKIGLELKWPNDIYGPNKTKIGGVLCESTVRAGSPLFSVVAGVGLNVLNASPTTSLRAMMEAAGLEEAALAVSREAVLAAACPQMEALLGVLQREGFAALSEEYCRMWMHSRQRVKVQAEDGGGEREAVVEGVAPSGFLLARDPQGAALELHPDGNRFDMMQGLIYRRP